MSSKSKLWPRKIWRAGMVCLALGFLGMAAAAWARSAAVEVRRLGLSRVGEHTMLTVILSQAMNPQVSTRTVDRVPQLVVEFPGARAGRLPTNLAGDDLLVEQVHIESSPAGVKIIVELIPDLPYNFWRQRRPAPGGQSLFILGLKPDPAALQARQAAPPEPPPSEPPPPPETPPTPETPDVATGAEPEPPPPGPEDYGFKEERGTPAAPGTFAELRGLIPKANTLLQGLEKDGWVISKAHTYDRPGQRFSRDYVLTHQQYPQLAVKIANLPGNTPLMPGINIIVLTTDNLGGETASEYRSLRQWSFHKIRQKFEDIGDFFDDALKPLRIKLRKETKDLVLRNSRVFESFLQRACPQKPELPQKFMKYVKQKTNQRFEGVQYTLSENPLVILNMVDFLYLKVFFLETR